MKVGLRLGNKWILSAAVFTVVVVGVIAYGPFTEGIQLSKFSELQQNQPAKTVTEVEALMGHPARIEHSESTGITADVYHYRSGSSDLKVVIINGLVFHAEHISGAKS